MCCEWSLIKITSNCSLSIHQSNHPFRIHQTHFWSPKLFLPYVLHCPQIVIEFDRILGTMLYHLPLISHSSLSALLNAHACQWCDSGTPTHWEKKTFGWNEWQFHMSREITRQTSMHQQSFFFFFIYVCVCVCEMVFHVMNEELIHQGPRQSRQAHMLRPTFSLTTLREAGHGIDRKWPQ